LFGIGGMELFLILLFGFLIFGPDKLPAIAKTVAQALSKFKNAQEEMTKVIKTEVYDPTSDEPFKNPLDALAKVASGNKPEEKTESFSERKAKYDKERAAKKATEERKAAYQKHVAPAAAAAKVASDTTKDTTKDAAAKESSAKPASQQAVSSKPKPTAEELYGNKRASTPKPAEIGKPASISEAKDATENTAAASSINSAAKKVTEEKGE